MSEKRKSTLAKKKKSKGIKKSNKRNRKIFTKSNINKVVLPSLALLLVILTPVLFEVFKTRHQPLGSVVPAPLPGNWFDDLFGGGVPSGDITTDPTNDTDPNGDPGNDPGGFMDGFTNGLATDPERILFIVSPADEYLYLRHQVYDEYLMDSWDRNITTSSISGYSGSPSNELSITTNSSYFGGSLVSNFPGPYHYQNGEQFSSNYIFTPLADWNSDLTTLEEDEYGCKSFSARFNQQSDNTTLNYNVAYTIQNNSQIKEDSLGFTRLGELIALNPSLASQYLQLPTNYTQEAPFTNQLANSLLNPSNTIYNQVIRNIMWLAQNATYDYDMLLGLSDEEPAPGEDYVEWFLNRRSGTAAHFAASLAILCRIQNIPSRIVVGFSYGERSGSSFIVRAKHVHSWTEVYLPINDTGYWVAFDSSPLLPQVDRTQYGANTIGFHYTFHCSNEFFIEPEHMVRIPIDPFFVPNPTSNAWYNDPYSGNWYGPYINRTQTFTLYAYLAEGSDADFYNFLFNGTMGNLQPIVGETVTFRDTTAGTILATALTNATGYAVATYSYPLSASVGLHYIVAEWNGIQAATYDLRLYTSSGLVPTGVRIRAVTNISSINPLQSVGKLTISESQCLSLGSMFIFSFIVTDIFLIRKRKYFI